MSKIVPLSFTPDLDTGWSVAPGAIKSMSHFAPLTRGSYGTVGSAVYVGNTSTIVGSELFFGQMFRQVNGSVRLLVFRKQNIDEYSSAGTRTNQGTGYSSSTTDWCAAGFGNAIVACNYLDATQISTGTTFAAIGSGCPKARLVAANSNFVMLADYDDGSNQYGDGWWCSALGNVNSWTASLSTQAANGRILECSGPITALVAFKDGFIAFKQDSIHLMEYVGPPYIWSVRTISNHIGCVGKHAVAEFAGKLYFMHTSGFYSFDGGQLVDIGGGVINSFLAEMAYVAPTGAPDHTALPLSGTQVVADDIENVVWFGSATWSLQYAAWHDINYGFNTVTGKWGSFSYDYDYRHGHFIKYVFARTSEVQSFNAVQSARVLCVYINSAGNQTGQIDYVGYPLASMPDRYPTFTTGVIGSVDGSARALRVYWRTLVGTESGAVSAVTAAGYTNESQLITNGTANGVINTTLDCADLSLSSRFMTFTFYGPYGNNVPGKKLEIAGLAIESVPSGR